MLCVVVVCVGWLWCVIGWVIVVVGWVFSSVWCF